MQAGERRGLWDRWDAKVLPVVCGIVAVLRCSSSFERPSPSWVLDCLSSVREGLPGTSEASADWAPVLDQAARDLGDLDKALRRLGGIQLLVEDEELAGRVEELCRAIEGSVTGLEDDLDGRPVMLEGTELENLNASFNRLKDALWSVHQDRLGLARSLRYLGVDGGPGHVVEAMSSIEMVLSALGRLEVRGRDSAGVHVLLTDPDLESAPKDVQDSVARRSLDPHFRSGALRQTEQGSLSFVYKAAAEIGELGDNGSELRQAIQEDAVLHALLRRRPAEGRPAEGKPAPLTVLGHTRWASVGLISEANAHPLNHEEVGHRQGPYVVAALNGDVDNYRALCEREQLELPEEITTDAKVIPVLISRRLSEGWALDEAFRRTVSSFSGSVAIAAQSSTEPEKLLLALHGSGQALYIGLMEDGFIVASEPYGVVEQASSYLRMDGETPGSSESPSASRGQIVILDSRFAGKLEGIERFAYDGTPLPVRAEEFQETSITTRDIDRGSYPHYLLKEISQAAESFRKTLRGKLVEERGSIRVALGSQTLPQELIERLTAGSLRTVIVIGQGTAAVAGRAIADAMQDLLPRERIDVAAMPATELSGFRLQSDMSDTLVVAISQSGTTTDTNRTVDLVRARGAAVVSIVNRRSSDLTDKSDGVLYTSDGRDVEMSVASTKAFYSQVAAGFLLALALKQLLTGDGLSESERQLIESLRSIPRALESVLDLRDTIARIAHTHAPGRRYWAVVGNGRNRAAAEEVRIKLSELCYKSIACDATEDKKHIDLSSEPLILVCAAGLSGSILEDVGKEVAIYRAHKALPIIIVSEGDRVFSEDADVIRVPRVDPSLAFILATMVGHLFAYEAALAIDSLAHPLREIRAQLEELAELAQPGQDLLESLAPRIEEPWRRLFEALGSGRYNGQLEASTAIRLASLLRYAVGLSPLEGFIAEHGEVGSPAVVIEALAKALTQAIEELTRPIDAIKHQAKTVTVGVSRADEGLLTVGLIREVVEIGLSREHLAYRDLRTLAGLDPAVAEVRGFTRYRVIRADSKDEATLKVIDQGGISRTIPSRTVENPQLRGTKHLVVNERQLLVARGLSDGRTFILIPEIDRTGVSGILLLHVRFREAASAAAMRGILASYRNRYVSLKDAVTETEPQFREEILAELPVADLLTEPIDVLAAHWQVRKSEPERVLE